MKRLGQDCERTFCYEAIGPLVNDTAGLTYSFQFFKHLSKDQRKRTVFLGSQPLASDLDLRGVKTWTMPRFTASGAGRVVAVQALVPLLTRKLGISALYCTGSIAPALIKLDRELKVIVNVQNAAVLQDTMILGGHWRDRYRRAALPAGLRRATQIITTSEFMKVALMDRYSIDSERITAVPLAVDTSYFQPTTTDDRCPNVPQPYILFVSALWPHKNASTLIRAFAELVKEREIQHTLVIVGKDGGDEANLRALAHKTSINERVIFRGQVQGPELPLLYRSADLFVYPSLIESFGLPPLEAMASGTPVVASNQWAVPEVCGEGAYLCDVTSVEELKKAIGEVIFSTELQADLARRGLKRVEEFSWSRTVAQTVKIIAGACQ